MIKTLVLVFSLLFTTTCLAQYGPGNADPSTMPESNLLFKLQQAMQGEQTPEQIQAAIQGIRKQIEGDDLDRLRTPQSEVEDAILFLSRINNEDIPFIRFFSTYAVRPEHREDTVLTLSFIIHSLVGLNLDDFDDGNAGKFYPLAKRENGVFTPYRRVIGSDTLWWIDIRDYNWTGQAWEDMSVQDGYFSKPIVSEDRDGQLRLLAGNAVVRADWFIFQAVNTTSQLDIGEEVDIYTTLLYAKAVAPNNIDEFRRLWGLDIEKARTFGNEYGVLITRSDAVSRWNRMLFGYRTELGGYLYETYDVNFQKGSRDYVEFFFRNEKPGQPPDVSDAGEAIATNALGLQVYALRNAEGDLVGFGDPTVVRHVSDVIDDVRVRTGHSCIDCHASGIIPAENLLDEIAGGRGKVNFLDRTDALRTDRALLSKKFERAVVLDQQYFAAAVKQTNGLDTGENGKLYLQAVNRYFKDVTLEQAAYECGVTVDQFQQAFTKYGVRYGFRLQLLARNGLPIPRDIWEGIGQDGIPSAFQQAMIIVHNLLVEERFFQPNQQFNIQQQNRIQVEVETPEEQFGENQQFNINGVQQNQGSLDNNRNRLEINGTNRAQQSSGQRRLERNAARIRQDQINKLKRDGLIRGEDRGGTLKDIRQSRSGGKQFNRVDPLVPQTQLAPIHPKPKRITGEPLGRIEPQRINDRFNRVKSDWNASLDKYRVYVDTPVYNYTDGRIYQVTNASPGDYLLYSSGKEYNHRSLPDVPLYFMYHADGRRAGLIPITNVARIVREFPQ